MAIIKTLEKEEVSEIAQSVYESFGESVPEWAKVMAHRPEILKEFTGLFTSIMNQGSIEPDLKWKIAYVVSETLKCKFCVSVTVKMLKKLGADENLLNDIKNLKGQEKDILELVKDLTLDGYIDNPEVLEKLKQKLTEPQMVEIVSVVGLFNYINRFNNTFAILPI